VLETLASLVVTIAIVGFVVWLVITYVPMPEPFRRIVVALVILILLIWLVRALAGVSLSPR
jgi:hypothetical protein